MFIPLRTNRPPKRRPVVTETLIVVNMLVYLAGLATGLGGPERGPEALIDAGHLYRGDFHVWQLVTYQFLHDPHSIWHLAFNMLFLWVFGCAVEDRLGRASYLGFYLIGGAVAGLAHVVLVPEAPVIGASGAIAGVTGAFLALFPRSRIQLLVVFFFIGVYSIPALWFVGFYVLIDVLRQAGELFGGGGARVAYMAHIAGYLYGFSLAFVLLALRIVKREEFDVFFLFQQSRRRSAFRAASRKQTAGLWAGASADTGRELERQARRGGELSVQEREQAQCRAEILDLAGRHQLTDAAAKYRDLQKRAPDTMLPEEIQLDVANQLHADGDHETAARAYELLLGRYPRGPRAPEIRLILGLIYTRHLHRPERASELIAAAQDRLTDPDQRALAEQLLAEIAG